MAVIRIVFRSSGILTIIDGSEQVKFVPICLVSRGVPCVDLVLELASTPVGGHFP